MAIVVAASLATLIAAQPVDTITINILERTNGQGFDLTGTSFGATAGNAPVLTDTDTLASIMNTAAETFGTLQEVDADLGGGDMSIGLSYGAGIGAAAGRFDLFSTAIHEIGHLLGLADLSQPGDPNFNGGQLNITSGPFSGAALDLTAAGGGHLDPGSFPIALMQPFTNGDRRLASEADIAAIAELSGFGNVDYTANKFAVSPPPPPPPPPAVIPLPAAGLMLLGGLGGLGMVTRRRRKA